MPSGTQDSKRGMLLRVDATGGVASVTALPLESINDNLASSPKTMGQTSR